MSEKPFVIHDSSVEEYIESLENKSTQGKTKRDVKLLNDFLGGEKKEERELSAINPQDLDRYLASIFSDRQFELTRRCLQSKQKELKKAGRGNKDKAAAPLTDQEIDVCCQYFNSTTFAHIRVTKFFLQVRRNVKSD